MFDPQKNRPKQKPHLVYLGACLIAGIRLAREKQVHIRVVPTITAMEESIAMAQEIFDRVYSKGASGG